MKITFVVTDFPVYSQTFVLQQIKNLIDKGHQVKILANYKPPQDFVQPIYSQYRLSEKTFYFRDNIYDPDSQLEELTKLVDEDTDIFHAHFLPTGVALVKALDWLKIVKPVLITGYGVDIMAEKMKGKYSYLNKNNVSFVAVSSAIKQKMVYLGIRPENIWIVPLTADTDYFSEIRKKKNAKTRFVSVCRLVEKKGIDLAIKAFNSLKKKHTDINFAYDIYGNGPESANLGTLIRNYGLRKQIKIHKPVDHKQIISIFAKSDFLIQTSKTALNGDGEGLPTVVLEAQSSGIPVIGTYHSGIPEEVSDGITGLLSDEKDIKTLADNLFESIGMSNKKYSQMARNARTLMEERFSDRTISGSMMHLYHKRSSQKTIKNINELKESLRSLLSHNPEKIKILFFNHTAGLGGSERSLLELLRELQELGAICMVVVPYEGDFCRELEKLAIEYRVIAYHWWCSLSKKTKKQQVEEMNNSFINLLKEKVYLDAWGADIVFTNTLTIPWGGIYSLISDKPHMTFIREFGDIDFGFDFFYGYDRSLGFIDNYSDYVFTNSKATLDHFSNHIVRGKSDYAYAYIEPDRKLVTQNAKKIFKLRQSLKLAVMGAIIPSKGQEEAIKAVGTLIKKGLNIELAIIGSKHDPGFLEMLNEHIKKYAAKSRIRFHDFVINPYPYMSQCDVLIVPSRNEAYGRVTIEAMSLAKAVIGTNSGATKEIVENKETGLLYEPGNFMELAQKIEFLYNNRGQVKKFGKNGYLSYKRKFDKNIYGMKVFEQLKRLVGNNRRNDALIDFVKDFSESTLTELDKKEQQINDLKHKQDKLSIEIERLNTILASIYSSKTWRLLYFYKRLLSIFKNAFSGK